MRILLVIFIVIFNSTLYAQFRPTPLINQFQSDFTKQHITWDWHNILTFSSEPAKGPGIRFKDVLHSNLIMPNRNTQQWRDENRLDAFLFYKSNAMYNGFYINSWSLTDRQTLNVTQYSNHAAGFKGDYNPIHHFSVVPYVGYQRSENIAVIDYGWDTGIDLNMLQYSLDGYNTNLQLRSDYDFFPKRQNAANAANVMIKKFFTPLTSDSLALKYSLSKQEYFAQNGFDIIRVNIEQKGLHNFLFYGLSPNSRLEFITLLESRNIFDDSPVVDDPENPDAQPNIRDVMRIENELYFRFFSRNMFARFGLHTFQETQDNQDIITDSKALHTSLNADMTYLPTIYDDVILKLSFVKFQYETPDTITNNDDRDELRFIGEVDYTHRFSPLLALNLNFYANMFHKMYIFQEQSANNNWNRIYRFSGAVQYRYKKFRNVLQTYVLANYTVYDYDELLEQTRSFVFRKYGVSDSLSIPILRDISFGFYGRLEMEDRGTFFERDFTQQLLDSNENIYYDMYLQKRDVLRLTVDMGVSVYLRRGWRYAPQKTLARDFSKTSPYLRVIYPYNQNVRFRAYFSYTNLVDTGRQNQKFAQGNLNLSYVW